MTSFVDRLKEASATRQRGVNADQVCVNRDDLRKLLHHFGNLETHVSMQRQKQSNCKHQWVTLDDCDLVDGCPKCGEQRA